MLIFAVPMSRGGREEGESLEEREDGGASLFIINYFVQQGLYIYIIHTSIIR